MVVIITLVILALFVVRNKLTKSGNMELAIVVRILTAILLIVVLGPFGLLIVLAMDGVQFYKRIKDYIKKEV